MSGRGLEAAEFAGRSVTKRTLGGYQKKHELFNEYRLTLAAGDDPGEWFEKCETGVQKAQEAALFYRYLFTVKGLREEQVTAVTTGLAFCLTISGHESEFLKSELAVKARKACKRTPAESRVVNQGKVERDKEPATAEILGEIRRIYWEDRTWDSKADMDARGSWLANALCYDSGQRIGNVTRRDGETSEDHCVRTIDVSVELSVPPQQPYFVKGSGALKLEIAAGHLSPKLAVTSARLVLLSSKSGQRVKTQMVPKVIERRSLAESELLDDLVEWMLTSGTLDTDELLTRYHGGSRRSITRKESVIALKAGAAALGLDPNKYSSKSLRGGFATAAANAGMSEEELHIRGGWAPGSKVPKAFYTTYRGTNRGGMAIIPDKEQPSSEHTDAYAHWGEARPSLGYR